MAVTKNKNTQVAKIFKLKKIGESTLTYIRVADTHYSHTYQLTERRTERPMNNRKIFPETLKYWVGVQRGKSYLMGRRCLFNLGSPIF